MNIVWKPPKLFADRGLAHSRNEHELDAAEFCRLLLSRANLVRSDEPGGDTRLLFDPASGKTYRIEAAKLDQYVESVRVPVTGVKHKAG
jgi:hypothetical protein